MDDRELARATPGRMQSLFANNRRVFDPLAERVRTHAWDEEVVPGVTAIGTPGHSIGHTSYLVDSGGECVFLIQDVSNHPALSLEHPGWHLAFDQDPVAAETTRRRTLDWLARERFPSRASTFRSPAGPRSRPSGMPIAPCRSGRGRSPRANRRHSPLLLPWSDGRGTGSRAGLPARCAAQPRPARAGRPRRFRRGRGRGSARCDRPAGGRRSRERSTATSRPAPRSSRRSSPSEGELVAVAEAAVVEPDAWTGVVRFLETTLELQSGDRVLKELMVRYPPGEGCLGDARKELDVSSRSCSSAHTSSAQYAPTSKSPTSRAPVVVRARDRRDRRRRAGSLATSSALGARRPPPRGGDGSGGAAPRRDAARRGDAEPARATPAARSTHPAPRDERKRHAVSDAPFRTSPRRSASA